MDDPARIQEALQSERLKMLQRNALLVEAATKLFRHFGSVEAVETAGTARQLQFLLYESVEDTPGDRLGLALIWMQETMVRTQYEQIPGIGQIIGEILETAESFLPVAS